MGCGRDTPEPHLHVLLRRLGSSDNVPLRTVEKWCESLEKEFNVRDAAGLRGLTEQKVIDIGSWTCCEHAPNLRAAVERYKNEPADAVAKELHDAEGEEVHKFCTEGLVDSTTQWYAVVGIISGLMVSTSSSQLASLGEGGDNVTISTITSCLQDRNSSLAEAYGDNVTNSTITSCLQDRNSSLAELYVVFVTISFVLGMGSIASLCHVTGILTQTFPQDRPWFFETFFTSTWNHGMLPNTLMITSASSLCLAMLVKTIDNGADYHWATWSIIGLTYGGMLFYFIFWIIKSFPGRHTRDHLHKVLKRNRWKKDMEVTGADDTHDGADDADP